MFRGALSVVKLATGHLAHLSTQYMCVNATVTGSEVECEYSVSSWYAQGLNAPPSSADVLSSTGARTVGWMAMYDLFVPEIRFTF